MKYKRNEIVSDLHKTSKSSKTSVGLLEPKFQTVEVYDFDKVKNLFCDMYRDKQKLRSCDAYYENTQRKDYLAIEFKNTSHFRLKAFFGEIEEKVVDSHMLLLETFWRKKKVKQVAENVKFLVVYNDALNYGKGVKDICKGFNQVEPIQGDKRRKTQMPPVFEDEEEFEEAKNNFSGKFAREFFAETGFIDKTEFVEDYINADYFDKMTENEIVEQ